MTKFEMKQSHDNLKREVKELISPSGLVDKLQLVLKRRQYDSR